MSLFCSFCFHFAFSSLPSFGLSMCSEFKYADVVSLQPPPLCSLPTVWTAGLSLSLPETHRWFFLVGGGKWGEYVNVGGPRVGRAPSRKEVWLVPCFGRAARLMEETHTHAPSPTAFWDYCVHVSWDQVSRSLILMMLLEQNERNVRCVDAVHLKGA